MKKQSLILLILFLCNNLLAQDVINSEKNLVFLWNQRLNDWVLTSERSDTVSFMFSKDKEYFLMYKKASGPHFKKFLNNREAWYSKDTSFYRIKSSEVITDIKGNKVIKLSAQTGIYNDSYEIYYSSDQNIVSFIYDNRSSSGAVNFSYKLYKNLFVISSGWIK